MRALSIVMPASLLACGGATPGTPARGETTPPGPPIPATSSSAGTPACPRPALPESAGAVSPRLAPELIQRVVRAAFGEFRKCYHDALAQDPHAAGKSETRFVIGLDGKVSMAQTTVTGNLPPEVGRCMEKAFQVLVFDAPSGGAVTVVYPIALKPDS